MIKIQNLSKYLFYLQIYIFVLNYIKYNKSQTYGRFSERDTRNYFKRKDFRIIFCDNIVIQYHTSWRLSNQATAME
jgi:hypothetical protein